MHALHCAADDLGSPVSSRYPKRPAGRVARYWPLTGQGLDRRYGEEVGISDANVEFARIQVAEGSPHGGGDDR